MIRGGRGHPIRFLMWFHIVRTSCSGLPNLPAMTFQEKRDLSSVLRVRRIFLSSSVQMGGELGEGTGDKEALRRRFPGAFGVALASRFFDGSCDAVESFGGVGTEAGTGASTRWWGGGRL